MYLYHHTEAPRAAPAESRRYAQGPGWTTMFMVSDNRMHLSRRLSDSGASRSLSSFLSSKIIVVPFGDSKSLGSGGRDDEKAGYRPDKHGRVEVPPAVATRLSRDQGILDTPGPNCALPFRRVRWGFSSWGTRRSLEKGPTRNKYRGSCGMWLRWPGNWLDIFSMPIASL